MVSAEGVGGWAFGTEGDTRVTVLVDGRTVAEVPRAIPRPDVHEAHPVSDSRESGFAFAFAPEQLGDGSGKAGVVVRFESEGEVAETEPVTVPRPSRRSPETLPASAGPFPPAVLQALAEVTGEVRERWTDEGIADAVEVLRFLVERGDRRDPPLFTWLSFVARTWAHATFVERNFPRLNRSFRAGDHDAGAVVNTAVEMLAIATHLATLRAHGVGGGLVEFGCFKGFSTAILSQACRDLGVSLDVFDSFAGLPESDSTFYRAGEFAGSLEEVRANVAAYGRPDVVCYHEGFFAETVPRWDDPDVALIWMDVDLRVSSVDVMRLVPRLPRLGCVFSHECGPSDFEGTKVLPRRTSDEDDVISPICDAFAADRRELAGRFIHGNTGAIWTANVGCPVLPTDALLALRDLSLGVAD
jgi:O-methyltransferase